SVFQGYGERNAGIASHEVGYDDLEIEQYPYDPERAKSLLAEAGYADGFEFQFDGALNGRVANSEEWTLAVAGYWEAIGLRPRVDIAEFAVFGTRHREEDNITALMWGAT